MSAISVKANVIRVSRGYNTEDPLKRPNDEVTVTIEGKRYTFTVPPNTCRVGEVIKLLVPNGKNKKGEPNLPITRVSG